MMRDWDGGMAEELGDILGKPVKGHFVRRIGVLWTGALVCRAFVMPVVLGVLPTHMIKLSFQEKSK
jgi:hypothetical protein